MKKIFLSHSSTDKPYVRNVFNQIGNTRAIMDEYTFRPGMKTIDEIFTNIEQTDLFVLFISDNSLNSEWVKTEITQAKEEVISNNKKRFFPIIIDRSITHKDPRIPDFIRENYNLQTITVQKVATRIILQRLRELIWLSSPFLEKKDNLFVGRNDIISQMEQRFDNLDEPIPSCIIATGLYRVGRKLALRNGLVKANIVEKSYRPSIITLDRYSGIEDFILKVSDLGFGKEVSVNDIANKNLDEKIQIACDQALDSAIAKEIIFIEDDGCLINYQEKQLTIVNWFNEILKTIGDFENITYCITTKFRYNFIPPKLTGFLYILHLEELNHTERLGLVQRYSRIKKIELSREDVSFFKSILTGYPEQAIFLVDIIERENLTYAKNHTDQIVDFNNQRVLEIMKLYSDNSIAMDLLTIIANYDFVSLDFLEMLFDEDEYYMSLVNHLLDSSIIIFSGKNNEYLRMNEIIKDYILRMRMKISNTVHEKIRKYIRENIKRDQLTELNLSEYFITVLESLAENIDIDPKYIIPSHYLSTVSTLYHKKRAYTDVIKLIDKIYVSPHIHMESRLKSEFQHFLCLSLARLSDSRFHTEVRKVNGADHNFLYGFYYRIGGNYKEAVKRFTDAISQRENFSMAKGELVRVYLRLQMYDMALSLAKENYNRYSSNAYNIQAYFLCVINSNEKEKNTILNELLEKLNDLKTDISQEMYMTLKAQYHAMIDEDEDTALSCIEESIRENPDSYYPLLIKFDIAEKFRNSSYLESAINELDSFKSSDPAMKKGRSVRRFKYWVLKGNEERARNILSAELSNMPDHFSSKMEEYIYFNLGI